jgi:hypothetical protein
LLRCIFRRFWFDESAQASAEYILMLTIALSVTTLFFKKFLQPGLARLRDFAVKRIETSLINADLHQIRLGR